MKTTKDEIVGVYKVRVSGSATVIAMPLAKKGDRYVLVWYPGGIYAYYPLQKYDAGDEIETEKDEE